MENVVASNPKEAKRNEWDDARKISQHIQTFLLRRVLWAIAGWVLRRHVRWADLDHRIERIEGSGETMPRWYAAALDYWRDRLETHWNHWKGVVYFAVSAYLAVQFLYGVGYMASILGPPTSPEYAFSVIRHISPVSPGGVARFVDVYSHHVSMATLAPVYSFVRDASPVDKLLMANRRPDDLARHLNKLEGAQATNSDSSDADGNGIDDDIEEAVIRASLARAMLNNDAGSESRNGINWAIPPANMPIQYVCGHMTQYEVADTTFYVRRGCYDLLRVMLDDRYFPQALLAAIQRDRKTDEDLLRDAPQMAKARDDIIKRNKDKELVVKQMVGSKTSPTFVTSPPCVCLSHLGFAEPGAYTTLDGITSQLFLDLELSPLSPEERTQNRPRLMALQAPPFVHPEIDATDEKLWHFLAESPRLNQPHQLKWDFKTLPNERKMRCYYGDGLGPAELAILQAKGRVEQEMRDYERKYSNDSWSSWINSFAHRTADPMKLQENAYQFAVDLRLNIAKNLHAAQNDQKKAQHINSLKETGWFDGLISAAGIPLMNQRTDQCTEQERTQRPMLDQRHNITIEAPASTCLLHCYHLHQQLHKRRVRQFHRAMEQYQGSNLRVAALVQPTSAEQRRGETDIDDYNNRFT